LNIAEGFIVNWWRRLRGRSWTRRCGRSKAAPDEENSAYCRLHSGSPAFMENLG